MAAALTLVQYARTVSLAARLSALLASFDESAHPRAPEGAPGSEGGQFVKAEDSSGGSGGAGGRKKEPSEKQKAALPKKIVGRNGAEFEAKADKKTGRLEIKMNKRGVNFSDLKDALYDSWGAKEGSDPAQGGVLADDGSRWVIDDDADKKNTWVFRRLTDDELSAYKKSQGEAAAAEDERRAAEDKKAQEKEAAAKKAEAAAARKANKIAASAAEHGIVFAEDGSIKSGDARAFARANKKFAAENYTGVAAGKLDTRRRTPGPELQAVVDAARAAMPAEQREAEQREKEEAARQKAEAERKIQEGLEQVRRDREAAESREREEAARRLAESQKVDPRTVLGDSMADLVLKTAPDVAASTYHQPGQYRVVASVLYDSLRWPAGTDKAVAEDAVRRLLEANPPDVSEGKSRLAEQERVRAQALAERDQHLPRATGRQIGAIENMLQRLSRIDAFDSTMGSGDQHARKYRAELERGISGRRASELIDHIGWLIDDAM